MTVIGVDCASKGGLLDIIAFFCLVFTWNGLAASVTSARVHFTHISIFMMIPEVAVALVIEKL